MKTSKKGKTLTAQKKKQIGERLNYLDAYIQRVQQITQEYAATFEALARAIKTTMEAHGFQDIKEFREAGHSLEDQFPGDTSPVICQILQTAFPGLAQDMEKLGEIIKSKGQEEWWRAFKEAKNGRKIAQRTGGLLKNSQVPSIPILNSRFSKLLRTDPALLSGDLVPIKRKGGIPESKRNPVILNARFTPPEGVVYTPRMSLTDAIGEMCFAATWERKQEKTSWTIDQICRMTRGQQDKQKITRKEQLETIAMCERLRRTTAYIEAPGGLVQESLCRVYLIAIYRDGAEETTENIIGYKLAAIPFVYNYDKHISHQVLSVTPDLLEILEPMPDGGFSAIPNTQNRTLVKWYLLLHLLSIRSGRLSSNVIRFDSMLQQLELEKAGRQTKSNVKEYAFKCLDYWTRKDFIGGYSRLKKGCGYYAVEISLESRHIDIKPKAQIAKKR